MRNAASCFFFPALSGNWIKKRGFSKAENGTRKVFAEHRNSKTGFKASPGSSRKPRQWPCFPCEHWPQCHVELLWARRQKKKWKESWPVGDRSEPWRSEGATCCDGWHGDVNEWNSIVLGKATIVLIRKTTWPWHCFRLCFHQVHLFDCQQDDATTQQISIKRGERIGRGPRKNPFNFGTDVDKESSRIFFHHLLTCSLFCWGSRS